MSPSAPSAAVGRRRRVLLVHANPFQRVTPVPAYGLERLRTAAEETGAEVQLLDPYLVSEDPLETAREAARAFRPDLIGLGIRIIDDCIVVDRLDAPDDEPIDVSFLLPEIRELRRALGEVAPEAMFVAGGAGFSACPAGVPRLSRRRLRRRRRRRGSAGHALFGRVLGSGTGTGPQRTG